MFIDALKKHIYYMYTTYNTKICLTYYLNTNFSLIDKLIFFSFFQTKIKK